jgi:hypothetical protein
MKRLIRGRAILMKKAILLGLTVSVVSTCVHAASIPNLLCGFNDPFFTVRTSEAGLEIIQPTASSHVAAVTAKIDGEVLVLTARESSGTTVFYIAEPSRAESLSGPADVVKARLLSLDPAGVAGAFVEGSCMKLPAGTSPKIAIGMSQHSQLRVRAAPDASAHILGSMKLYATFWAYPEPALNGWIRGAMVQQPPREGEPVRFVEGWASENYLGTLERLDPSGREHVALTL